jgi:uncharacterized protein YuzB (UPF0349 family)
MHIVEFCVSNQHHGSERTLKRLEELPQIEVIEYGCLGNCGECFLLPFAIVNGEIVASETGEELYDAVLAAIGEHQEKQAALDKLLDDL